ncbi:MAG TPA: hypothetical protein VGL37_02585 [Solirubrobacteraceae bacterium]
MKESFPAAFSEPRTVSTRLYELSPHTTYRYFLGVATKYTESAGTV